MSIYVVAAKRTAFGSFGGSLKGLSATDLCVASTKAALSSGKVDPSLVGSVLVGNVIQSSPDAAYLARHVALKSGCGIPTPALSINRLCGSGFETVALAANAIKLGEAGVVVAGGAENMSAAPLQIGGNDARWGVQLGKGLKVEDALWAGLTDSHAGTPMGVTAENLAEKYGVTREECDAFAIQSQQRWGVADKAGVFDAEMAPIEVKGRKGPVTVGRDEHPKPETQLEKIAGLKPVFKKDGVVTAASASGICDGAGTIILASEEAVEKVRARERGGGHHVWRGTWETHLGDANMWETNMEEKRGRCMWETHVGDDGAGLRHTLVKYLSLCTSVPPTHNSLFLSPLFPHSHPPSLSLPAQLDPPLQAHGVQLRGLRTQRDGHRPRAGHPKHPGRPRHDRLRRGPLRGERGLCGAVPVRAEGARPAGRQDQRQRRGHLHRAPARGQRQQDHGTPRQ